MLLNSYLLGTLETTDSQVKIGPNTFGLAAAISGRAAFSCICQVNSKMPTDYLSSGCSSSVPTVAKLGLGGHSPALLLPRRRRSSSPGSDPKLGTWFSLNLLPCCTQAHLTSLPTLSPRYFFASPKSASHLGHIPVCTRGMTDAEALHQSTAASGGGSG